MRHIGLFGWLVAPAAIWAILVLWGSPHIALTYRFLDNGDRYNPRAERIYIDCTYYGYLGAITFPAKFGSCPWIRFIKADDGGLR